MRGARGSGVCVHLRMRRREVEPQKIRRVRSGASVREGRDAPSFLGEGHDVSERPRYARVLRAGDPRGGGGWSRGSGGVPVGRLRAQLRLRALQEKRLPRQLGPAGRVRCRRVGGGAEAPRQDAGRPHLGERCVALARHGVGARPWLWGRAASRCRCGARR